MFDAEQTSIDIDVLPQKSKGDFWSSTPYAHDSGNAWVVFFFGGNSVNVSVANEYSVRCVH